MMEMTVAAEEVQAMVAGAIERVREGWMPPRSGGDLSTKLSDDMPPLTTGIVEMYLAAYAWLWERDTPAEEARRVTDVIRNDAMIAWTRMDFTIRNGVLAVCALWADIQQRSAEDREAIRELLGARATPGVYAELERPAAPAQPAATGVEVKKELITTNDIVMGALQTQFKTGPGF
jgi:hypothetical protein